MTLLWTAVEDTSNVLAIIILEGIISILVPLASFSWLLIYIADRAFNRCRVSSSSSVVEVKPSIHPQTLSTIEPLPHFDCRNVEPERYRPSASKVHVVKGTSKIPRFEWIKIDHNYIERISRRKILLSTHPQICMGSNEISYAAIQELFEDIMVKQLPTCFPAMFSVRSLSLTR